MPFLMIRNDITKVCADAIVNPANTQLQEGSGTSRAIYLAAGEKQLISACKKIGYCDEGKAVITDAFHLPAKYIIHAVGPVWQDGNSGEEDCLYHTYMESLNLAVKYKLDSIAFPLLSSGNYGFPKEKALKIAISAISDFLLEQEMLVYLVIYDKESLSVSKKLIQDIEEYIDNNYIDKNKEDYHSNRRQLVNRDISEYKECQFFRRSDAPKSKVPMPIPMVVPIRSIDDLVNNMDETFSQMLMRLIKEKGMTNSQVYKKANIDRKLFSKIRKDIHYSPSKKTVLAFAFALELSLDEAKDLLFKAGYALSKSNKFDVIIEYFFIYKIYNIFEINEVLFTYDQPLLGQ